MQTEIIPAKQDLGAIIALAVDGLASERSRTRYTQELDRFLTWYTSNGHQRLTKAAVQAYKAHLQEAGFAPLRMAVNLSSRQFQQKELKKIIIQILDDTGLDRNWLEVELTEGCLMENTEVTVTTLRPLKAMGIGISIDDFGTGYSSLGRLKRFPIDTLKIDRSFVKDISTDPDDTAIITAILAMAKSLNLQVVAEGVETEAQLNFS